MYLRFVWSATCFLIFVENKNDNEMKTGLRLVCDKLFLRDFLNIKNSISNKNIKKSVYFSFQNLSRKRKKKKEKNAEETFC